MFVAANRYFRVYSSVMIAFVSCVILFRAYGF